MKQNECKNCGHKIKEIADNFYKHTSKDLQHYNQFISKQECICTNPEPIIILPESRKAKAEHSNAITDEVGLTILESEE